MKVRAHLYLVNIAFYTVVFPFYTVVFPFLYRRFPVLYRRFPVQSVLHEHISFYSMLDATLHTKYRDLGRINFMSNRNRGG